MNEIMTSGSCTACTIRYEAPRMSAMDQHVRADRDREGPLAAVLRLRVGALEHRIEHRVSLACPRVSSLTSPWPPAPFQIDRSLLVLIRLGVRLSRLFVLADRGQSLRLLAVDQVDVGESVEIVRIDRQRLIERLDPLVDDLLALFLRHGDAAVIRARPAVDAERVPGFLVGRVHVGTLLEVFERLREVALLLVERRDLVDQGEIVRTRGELLFEVGDRLVLVAGRIEEAQVELLGLLANLRARAP